MKHSKNTTRKVAVLIAVLSVFFLGVKAQDGAGLFKANCAACHKIDKASVGPKLAGVKAKWEEAGEAEMLYEWVADPTSLFESGKSKMAKEIWDFSPAPMTAQAHLTREEVDAIFEYADTPPPAPAATEGGEGEGGTAEVAEEESLISPATYYMLITIALILITALSVFKYAKRAFNGEDEAQGENAVAKALTNAVAIENEDSILLDHEYDGIKELDNALPPWWVWMFYATIVFSFAYVGIYHVFKSAPLQDEAYEIEMAQAEAEVEAYKESVGMTMDENTVELLTEAGDLSSGETIYMDNCKVCHGEKGEGIVGPNLNDNSWIYGYDIKDVFKTVKYGTDKGMPQHETVLNPLEIQQVSSYVLALEKTEGGKAAEGDITE